MPQPAPIRITIIDPAYIRVTFNNPPINLFDQQVYNSLEVLRRRLVHNKPLRIVVFDTANQDYFIAPYDVLTELHKRTAKVRPSETNGPPWSEFVEFLSTRGVVTIASIRGIARGIGHEFVQSCSIRYASIESARFPTPGNDSDHSKPTTSHASGALFSSNSPYAVDYDPQPIDDGMNALNAERVGYVTRAVHDHELDEYVHSIARTFIASTPSRNIQGK